MIFKKVLCIFVSCAICILSFCSLVGCNQNIGMGTLNFNRAHISVGDGYACVEVKSWCENEVGCEIKLKDGTSLYCSEGTYILIDGDCPICKDMKK